MSPPQETPPQMIESLAGKRLNLAGFARTSINAQGISFVPPSPRAQNERKHWQIVK
jgi:hypothetical protein